MTENEKICRDCLELTDSQKDLEEYCFTCSRKLGRGKRFYSAYIEEVKKGIIPEGMTENEKICMNCLKLTDKHWDLEEYCFTCSRKLGRGKRFYSAYIEEVKKGIIPEGMTENEKICRDCLELTDSPGDLVLYGEIGKLELKQKESNDGFEEGKCHKQVFNFSISAISLIQSILKKEIDEKYLAAYIIISAQCITHFGRFWNEYDACYFECSNITLDIKKYKEYVLECVEGHEREPYAKDDLVWVVLVTTICLMSMIVTRNNGKLSENTFDELNLNFEQLERKIESFLGKFKLPKKSVKPNVSKKSKPSMASVTKKEMDKNFKDYTWQDMENMVGELFEKKGYEVTVTQSAWDFGIDVEARNDKESIGIQVKHWNADVGYEVVAKTLGSSMGKFNRSIIINSKSGFTSQAWQKQSEMPYVLDLWDSNKLKNEIKKAFFTTGSKSGKFCIRCGTKNIDKAKFCHECGESLVI